MTSMFLLSMTFLIKIVKYLHHLGGHPWVMPTQVSHWEGMLVAPNLSSFTHEIFCPISHAIRDTFLLNSKITICFSLSNLCFHRFLWALLFFLGNMCLLECFQRKCRTLYFSELMTFSNMQKARLDSYSYILKVCFN